MPKIQAYDAGNEGLQVPSGGEEAFAAVGRRSGQFFHQIGEDVGGAVAGVGKEVQQHDTQQEISQGSAALATLAGNLTDQWNQTAKNADPNDPTTASKFQAQLEPQLQSFSDNFSTAAGKQWAQERVGELRQHLYEKTAADQSTMAGDATFQNVTVLKNRASQWVANDPSQHTLNAALGLVDNSISALVENSGVTGAAAAKMKTELSQNVKTEIAKAGFTSMAEKNPDAALAALKGGAYSSYIDGTEGEQYIKTVQRAQRADAANARITQEYQTNQRSQANAGKLLAGVADPATGAVSVPGNFASDALKRAGLSPNDPNYLKPAEALTLVQFANSRANIDAKGQRDGTDPTVHAQFTNRLGLPPDDPNALTASDVALAKVNHQLSDKDYAVFSHAVNAAASNPQLTQGNKQFAQFTNALKTSITKSNTLLGIPDPEGDQRFYNFQINARAAWEAGNRDPKMLDPNSSNYLGKLAVPLMAGKAADAAGQQAEIQARIQSKIGGQPGQLAVPVPLGAKARQPGESPSDYLKRVSGGQ